MLYRSLVHRSGTHASHMVGCRATRFAILIDPNDAEMERYVALRDRLDVQIRVIVRSTAGAASMSAAGRATYESMLADLGLERSESGEVATSSSFQALEITPAGWRSRLAPTDSCCGG